MADINPINVVVGADYVLVPNGLGGTKKIALQEFIQELNAASEAVGNSNNNNSNERSEHYVYPASMVALEEGKTTKRLVLYFEERRSNLQHTQSENLFIPAGGTDKVRGYEDCVIPNTVVVVTLRFQPTKDHRIRWTLSDVRWLATPLSRAEVAAFSNPRVGDSFSPLPFNNQYENGNMCTGGNTLQSVYYTDFSVAESLYYVTLLGSPFNNDLGLRGVTDSASSKPHGWYNYLQYCDKFPYRFLRGISNSKIPPADGLMTVSEFLEKPSNERKQLILDRKAAVKAAAIEQLTAELAKLQSN